MTTMTGMTAFWAASVGFAFSRLRFSRLEAGLGMTRYDKGYDKGYDKPFVVIYSKNTQL
jgi:hypothetical protein